MIFGESKLMLIYSHKLYCFDSNRSLAVKLPSTGINRLNYSTSLNLTILTELKEMLEDSNPDHVIVITGLKWVQLLL